MMNKEEIEKQILWEMKELAKKIEQVHTPTGLLLYQADIQKMYENFVLLKALSGMKIDSNVIAEFNTTEAVEKTPIKTETKEELFVEETVDAQSNTTENTQSNVGTNGTGKINFDFNINSISSEYPKLQLDVNDSIAFQKILFNNDKAEFDAFLEGLNERDRKSSTAYINHYIDIMEWTSDQEEYVDRLFALNNQRFE